MNNSIFRGLSVIAILFCMIGVSYLNAAKDPNKDPNKKSSSRLEKTGDINDDYKVLNINNVSTWVKFDGLSNHSPGGDNGLYYPRGTKWVIYEDGLVYGGKVFQNAAKT
ncbi:MAG TPA: hypothetical protein VI704_07330, partial [Bacteroidota bacterium]|nr:hypothetical protein [Bacteroidota bacterium]